jgi:hypothetical protein
MSDKGMESGKAKPLGMAAMRHGLLHFVRIRYVSIMIYLGKGSEFVAAYLKMNHSEIIEKITQLYGS